MSLYHRLSTIPAHDMFQLFSILRPGSRGGVPEKAEAARAERLRRVVAYAWENVPHYRRLFDQAGLTSRHIRSLDDLRRIPITSRRQLISAPAADTLSRKFKPADLLVFKTSGATGMPLTVYQSRYESFVLHLVKLRTLRALGLAWRDKMIKVRSRAHSYRPPSWKLLQRLGLLRQEAVEAQTPELIAAALRGKSADVLTGYTGTLVRVGQVLAGDMDRRLKPRFLVCGSETMTPFIRSQIESCFGAPVRDTYICQETGVIAWECPASGRYHVVDDLLIVEVLKDGLPCPPGGEGEVVVTNLVCRSMPFIRYRLEDRVTVSREACPCGRRMLTLDRILGKLQDYFWLPGGREFNPWDLSGLWLGRTSWILQYELVQEAPGSVVMRIVPNTTPPPGDIEALSAQSRNILGEGVDFRVELASDIKPSPAGKFRVHRSLVRTIYDNPLDHAWFG